MQMVTISFPQEKIEEITFGLMRMSYYDLLM